MAIYDYLPKFNYIEPNNLKGLQPGFVVAQESRVADALLNEKHKVDDKKVFFENGKICALSADGIVAGAADSKALFIHYTEPLNTVYESDRFFAVDTRTECPRLVQLIPGDEWMSTDANCAIEGRIIKIDTEGKEGWYGVSTMANGDTGYHYVFLG